MEDLLSFSSEAWAIMITVVATGFGVAASLVGMGWRTSSRLGNRISEDKASADADRRAFQAGMDAFKGEMKILSNRQSHLEGRMHLSPAK